MIAAYRNVRGISKDDPNPKTAPFTHNLAVAENAPYPNLASVPPPPSRAMTAAQRQDLTKNLIAARGRLQTTDEKLRAGQVLGWKPPPPPPALPPGAEAGNPPAPAGHRTAALPAGSGPRKPGAPPAPQPRESRLIPPKIAALPQPEATKLPPSRPHVSRTPGAKPAPPLPATMAGAGYRPPPAPPKLAAISTPAAAPSAPAKPSATVDVAFAGRSTTLGKAAHSAIERIAALYRRHAGEARVRVIGYAGAGGGSAAELKDFQLALDRAHALAAALERAGVPAKRISAEAAPLRRAAQQGHAEMRLED